MLLTTAVIGSLLLAKAASIPTPLNISSARRAVANPGNHEDFEGFLTTIDAQSGVPAMHAALMPNGKVIFLDKIEDYTQLKLANGQYAYSAEFDPTTGEVVPLSYKSKLAYPLLAQLD